MFTRQSSDLNNYVINAFKVLPYVKILIYLLLVIIMVILIMSIFKKRSLFREQGVSTEITNIKKLKQRDRSILRWNKLLRKLTNFVQGNPFRITSIMVDYYQYNINRAGLKAPGGSRYLSAEEFNAIVRFTSFVLLALALFILVFLNSMLGIVLMISIIATTSTLPNLILRAVVADKDRQIRENFADMYLMLHYVLMLGGNTPVDKILRSYAKTTSSDEMKRFVDNCVNHIETYGEYNATKYIAMDYREIPEVCKLMRLIRQLADGGDIRQELIGFREELIQAKRRTMEKRVNKLVGRARAVSNVLMILLVQAILSAMAIYLPDLSLIKVLLGLK